MGYEARCHRCHSAVKLNIGFAKPHEIKNLKRFLGSILGKNLLEENPEKTILVKLPEDNTIVGSLGVLTNPECTKAYLTRLKIDRTFRRQGLAKYLMRNTLQQLKRDGYREAFAVTLHKGPSALVEKLGALPTTKEEMSDHIGKNLIARFGTKHTYWRFIL